MRDYLIASLVLASIPIGLFRPYYGMLVYAWISYMNPHMLTWSFAQRMPVAKLAGVSFLLGMVLQRHGDLRPLRQRENILMILLFMTFLFSSLFAIYPDRAWPECQDMAKIILISLVTSTVLTDRKKLWYFFLVVAFSLGFYGVKGGIFSLMTGGKYQVLGPSGETASIIGANNAIGLALNMCLPMFWYLSKNTHKIWLKNILYGSFFLTIPAIMFTYSRASALALGIVLLSILMKGKKKILAIILLIAVGSIAVNYLPESWLNRQQSTLEYEQDSSAMSRFGEWGFAWRVALDRPLTGGGFDFQSWEVFAKYAPEFLDTYNKIWDTHSVYFGILSDHGFPGLLVFLSMIGLSLSSLWRIKRVVRDRTDLQWLTNYCDMIQVSFVGFLANGAFVNMEYFDLVYHWVGAVASLKVIAQQELSTSHAQQPEGTILTSLWARQASARTGKGAGVAPIR
jgi:probable O-glycosylation ligase (exosortase A-associated)